MLKNTANNSSDGNGNSKSNLIPKISKVVQELEDLN